MFRMLIGWDVYLGDEIIDTVWFTAECDSFDVRQSLVDDDGYSHDIEIYRVDESEEN